MAAPATYVLDTNVLVEAKRRYYRFGLCPGFWDCLAWQHKQGVVRSIDRVRKELDLGNDDLTRWARKTAPVSFFAATTQKATAELFGQMVAWAQSQPQYLPPAITKFATGADGWLIAYAKSQEFVVVTHELPSAEAKKEIKIPNVCQAFGVEYIDTFDMLERLSAVFTWKAKG